MGGIESHHLKLQKCRGDKFLPSRVYTPFPSELNSAPGSICIKFKPVPTLKVYEIRTEDDQGPVTWIVDSQFIPFCDNLILTSVGAYYDRGHRSPINISHLVQGLICKWTLGRETVCKIYRGSNTSSQPRIHPHPNGRHACYVGRIAFKILDLETAHTGEKERETIFQNLQCCALSPNGGTVAYLYRSSLHFFLGTLQNFTSNSISWESVKIRCDHVCSDFLGTRRYTEKVECKWSPDSSQLAFCISTGGFGIVHWPEMSYCFNNSDLVSITNSQLCNASCFEFHPMNNHDHVTFANTSNEIFICDITSNTVTRNASMLDSISCMKFGNTRKILAVGCENGTIHILDGSCLRKLYMLNAVDQPYGMLEPKDGRLPSFLRMSFSTFDEHLATSSNDGFVRVWQLQPNICLQNLSRQVILSHTPIDVVCHLPLPDEIKRFLLQLPPWASLDKIRL